MGNKYTMLEEAQSKRLQSEQVQLLELPVDRPRSARQNFRATVENVLLPAVVATELKRLSATHEVELQTLLLAAYQTFLHRYTGQEEIVLGVVWEHGWQAVQADIVGELTFVELLTRAGETVAQASTDRQATAWPEQSFQLVFEWLPAVAVTPEESQTLRALNTVENITMPDLIFSAGETIDGLTLSWVANAELYAQETVQRMTCHFGKLLESVVSNPQQALDALSMLPEEEREQLLVEWNRTAVDDVEDRCVHELFAEQAAKTPDAVAVVYEQQRLTYAELNARANRLAHYLKRYGVGPDVTVGLCVERSLELIVGLLAVVKAGGAYLPLDPANPAERLRFIMEDAQVPLLLTQDRLLPQLPESRPQTFRLDADWSLLADESEANPVCELTLDNMFYVIYTSGTTGKPKGVSCLHRGPLNLLQNFQTEQPIHAGEGCSVWTSFGFDVSVYEIFSALTAGGRLHVVADALRTESERFFAWMVEQEIHNAYLPPFMVKDLLTWLEKGGQGLQLNRVVLAVEPFQEQLLAQLMQRLPGLQLINAYGPTETSILSTYYLAQADSQRLGNAPIGRPVQNTKVYLLDKRLQPVPIGVPGELHIGGHGVARGYLNRPELTEEKFIQNPFGQPGERLYKTGDLVRYLPDGNILFIGRSDHQVKVRGFRIELGEIETVLKQHPSIQGAVVQVFEVEPGDKRIVAHLATGEAVAPTTRELREFLSVQLPDYMVPSAFVLMERLPYTPNGKIDRRALPIPDLKSVELDNDFVAPRTPLEQQLVEIWREVLGVAQLGIHDPFLDLGGHSLLAVRILTRIREQLQIDLSLQQMFVTPTVAELAAAIAEKQREGKAVVIDSIPRVPRTGDLPVSFAQERIWFINKVNPNERAYVFQAYLRFYGQLRVDAVEQAFTKIIERHEMFRTTFHEVNEVPVQRIHPPYEVQIPVVDLTHLPEAVREDEAQRMMTEEMSIMFDFAQLPLVRWVLYKINDEEHLMLHIEHHLVHDGWSFSVFLHEFNDLYRAIVLGELSPLQELPIQFADFAQWHREWLEGEQAKEQFAYWKQKLAGAQTVLELPADFKRPPLPSHVGTSIRIELPVSQCDQIHALARSTGATLYATLLATFNVLLYRYTGQEDMLVGAGVANRRRRDIENVMGMIVNNIVLRTELGPDLSFRELLSRVRDTTFEAFAHEDLPFDRIVEAVNPPRDLSRNPLMQVLFSFHDSKMPNWHLPGLEVEMKEALSNGSAKFDLNIISVPHPVPRRSLYDRDGEMIGLSMVWEFSFDLFERATIERMIGHFRTLLSNILANPDRKLSEFMILTAVEQQLLTAERTETALEQRPQMTLDQLFAAQVERTPDAVALVHEDRSLTYRELNERANRLAHHLQSLGVGPNVLVNLFADRSLDLVVGLLGILKAGGAYVPIDTAYPEERIALIFEDTEAPVLVTQSHLLDKLPAQSAQVVCLDTDWTQIATQSEHDPQRTVQASDLAYMIYTSGSTGRPKAVMVEHGSVASTLLASGETFGFRAGDVLPWMASVAFDIALFELFNPLLCGGTSVILTRQQVLDVPGLIDGMAQYTALHTVPSLMRQIVQAMQERQLPDEQFDQIRLLFIGGDAVPPDLLEEMDAVFCNAQIHVLYGPTEGTIICSHYPVPRGQKVEKNWIGSRLPQAELRVYDPNGNLVPVGVPGELYIGGHGVSRGYFRREELTAEKFVTIDGRRWYKSGDLVRRLVDGTFEFLGRIDNQVKIRGFRIELGEIEAHLNELADVREAVVAVREFAPGDKRLIAYVVTDPSEYVTEQDLRRALKDALPDYMVPSAFVLIDALSLNHNGKVDMRMLESLYEVDLDADQEVAAPRTPTEELVVDLFAHLLGTERVGLHDDFFERGGHSLLVTKAISRLNAALDVALSLKMFFENATAAGLAECIDRLRHDGSTASKLPIVPVPRDQALPLSFAQQRLWFLDLYDPGQAVYNMPFSMRLTGALDVTALERSLQEIVRRHESLRTTFACELEDPVQVIAADATLQLAHISLEAWPVEQREAEMLRLVREESGRPFDLQTGPLLRVSLIRLHGQEHVLVLNMHHIVSDGTSLGVMVKELAALYAAYAAGQPSPLANLPIQYADYAVWQREWLQGEVLEEQLRFWREQLGGELPVLALPTDRPRPAVQTFNGDYRVIEIPSRLVKALKTLNLNAGTTMYMTLLAVFNALLYRYTAQEDLVVGTPVAGRNRSEVEGLVGFFINTLTMRTDLRGNPTFAELLRRVRKVALDAYAHPDVPFEKLVEELQPERDLSRPPLFQVAFQVFADWELTLPGLTVERLEAESYTAKFDLSVTMFEEEDRFVGRFGYNTDLFDETTIDRMMGHYFNLLESIVENQDLTIGELTMLSSGELAELQTQWETAPETQPALTVQLFEAQVERTPDAVAVAHAEQELTYRELNERANRLARYLQQQGVGPDERVTLCVERSPELVVSLLGILKAGGAYVPIDTEYPQERIALILEDAQAPVLVTQAHLLDKFPAHQARVVCLDTDREQIAGQASSNLQTAISPSNLAYMIYTSGSTGRPKAVMVEHGNLVSTLQASGQALLFRAGDVMPWIASVAFDITLFELMNPLLSGGTSVVLTREQVLTVSGLVRDMAQFTMIHTVPSLMRQIIEAIQERGLPSSQFAGIRAIFIGGDIVSPDLLRDMYDVFENAQVHVLYGPTEGTIICSHYPVPRGQILDKHWIGTRLPQADLRVYDAQQNLVPLGVPGELYIGGLGVSRGYYGRPELTEEKFVQLDGRRWYRTGDLVRRMPNGLLEFLGRIDNQVKIRGFRIEVGEIEAHLLAQETVREAVVTVKEFAPGDKRLIAFVVAEPGTNLTDKDLRQALKQALPDFMVPSAFVLLEALPLNHNGKVDMRALQALDLEQDSDRQTTAPRNQEEALIVALFAELLGREQVGIYDNFFDLGGHSLLATRVISRLNSAFGVDLSLKKFFEQPTPEALVQHLNSLRQADATLAAQPILPVARDQELPMSFAQRRLWFLDQYEPGNPVYNLPIALRICGELHMEALERSLQAIYERHEVLRTTFADESDELIQVIAPVQKLAVAHHSLELLPLAEREAEMLRLVGEESRRAFDLEKGPLFHASILRLYEQEHVLIVNIHHIVSDGWSIGILENELSALYAAFVQGQASPLPALPIQYADYAVWQRDWLNGGVLEQQLAYWKQQLSGKLPVLQLPSDHPRPAVRTYKGDTYKTEVSPELSAAIKALSRQEDATLFMTMLAAYKSLLSRYTGIEDILVGTPIAGRNRAEIEGVFGFFVNTLVMRTDLSSEPTFREVLRRVRQMSLDAFAHQDVPFEYLVDELRPERHVSITPLFQVMFVLQTGAEHWELQGLDLEPLRTHHKTAKFDLTLTVVDHGDELAVHVEYNTDMYEPATIARFCDHYVTLLQGIVQQPEQRISQLPLLTEAERQQLVVEWNDTAMPFPDQVCLHQLFEEQAQRTPHNVAAIIGEQTLTYAELDAQANRLAHHLRALGVGPDVPVGVCMERSLELVVALVGILKAGGAFVPLDTEAPTARIRQVLEDATAPVCLTQDRLRGKVPDEIATYIYLDQAAEALQQYPSTAPQVEVTPDHLVSIYYTSGSTGKPKGVSSTHRGWVNRMFWMQRQYQLEAYESVLQKTTLTFDDAACEFYWPLLVGARIALMEPGLHKDPRAILHAAIQYQVAFITFVPSMLALVVDAITPQDRLQLKCLRHVGSSGEALRSDLVRAFRERIGCELHNTWGATEVSIDSTIHTCTAADEHVAEIVSVGRPIDNNTCYVLDKYLQPVPIGVAGDLYLGGVGLATGYLNDPEKTATAFLPNPFVPGERIYKTGDRGYLRADGCIMFLGRQDDQVKVRGQRVELAEIEAVLSTHPALQQAVVVAFKRPDGYLLAAYYVLIGAEAGQEAPHVTAEALRAYMSERLPDYMVPWRFVAMDSLPKTESGKIDRKQLPDPGDERPELAEAYVEASTATEQTIAAIWQEMLELNQVGVRDNFFELGGHSLTATRIISRINRQLGVQLPLRDLFETPTIHGLAEKVARARNAGQLQVKRAIPRLAGRTEYPLSHAMQRFWFQHQFDPEKTSHGVINPHVIDGVADTEALLSAYRELVARHEIMRTTLAEREEGVVQVVHAELDHPIQYRDLTALAAKEQAVSIMKEILVERRRPFVLTRDTFFRAFLYKLADDKHILMFCVHPISYDGWSVRVFLDELTMLYQAVKAGQTNADLPPALQYGEYAVWQHQQLTSPEMIAQQEYWQQKLARDLDPLQLPHDFAEPPVKPETMIQRHYQLDQNLVDQLRKLAAQQGTTMYLTLLSGFKMWLALVAEQEEITICSPISGRSQSDLEGVLGLMVNPLAMRTDLSGNPTAQQVLERVKETALGAYANQDYPFDLIMHDMRARRGGDAAQQLYSIVFVGQNAHRDVAEMESGVTIKPSFSDHLIHYLGLDPEADIVKQGEAVVEFGDDPTVQFDLHIAVEESGERVILHTMYNNFRFYAETVDQFLSQYEHVLQQVASDTELRLSQLELSELGDLF